MQAALGSRYQFIGMQHNHRSGRYLPVGTRKQINLTFVSTEEVPPEKVIGLLLDIIEMKRANFAPTYAGIDMLKIEGGIDRYFLGNGCKIVSSRKKSDPGKSY